MSTTDLGEDMETVPTTVTCQTCGETRSTLWGRNPDGSRFFVGGELGKPETAFMTHVLGDDDHVALDWPAVEPFLDDFLLAP